LANLFQHWLTQFDSGELRIAALERKVGQQRASLSTAGTGPQNMARNG